MVWKYSLSSYHDKTNSGYYYCSDTRCSTKGIYKVIIDENIKE